MVPRRTRLAIAAVLDVALLARGRPLPARTLASRHAMAPRQFESLLQDLVKARLLKSLRGPQGGYELARERRRIRLGDIVRALDGAPDPAYMGPADTAVDAALAEAAAAFLQRLDTITIEDLCGRAGEPEPRDRPAGADFTI